MSRVNAAALQRCRLYGIIDLAYVRAGDVARVAIEMIAGGVDIIQLRGKGQELATLTAVGAKLHTVTRAGGVPLVINDHAEVSREIRAEGVHVGQDDLSVTEARKIAGAGCLVGKSTHSVEQATQAAAEGADYIGFGPLFATPTKPEYTPIGLDEIREVHQRVTTPIFCIGGIKLHNLPQVIGAGARRIVIVSEMLQTPDIAKYARTAREQLSPKLSA